MYACWNINFGFIGNVFQFRVKTEIKIGSFLKSQNKSLSCANTQNTPKSLKILRIFIFHDIDMTSYIRIL